MGAPRTACEQRRHRRSATKDRYLDSDISLMHRGGYSETTGHKGRERGGTEKRCERQQARGVGASAGMGPWGEVEDEVSVRRAIATWDDLLLEIMYPAPTILGRQTDARHTGFAAAYLSSRLSPPHHRYDLLHPRTRPAPGRPARRAPRRAPSLSKETKARCNALVLCRMQKVGIAPTEVGACQYYSH